MPILYIDATDVTSAKALGEVSGEGVVPLKATTRLTARDTDITLAAHTSNDGTIGGKKPVALAESFAKMFEGQDMTKLQDIYLISCEAGVPRPPNKTGPSLAQQFAAEMHTKGFTNLKVHAAVNPTDKESFGVRVEVVTNPGLKGERENEIRGNVKAYYYQNKDSLEFDNKYYGLKDQINTLEAEYDRLSKEITEIITTKQPLRNSPSAQGLLDTLREQENIKTARLSEIKAQIDPMREELAGLLTQREQSENKTVSIFATNNYKTAMSKPEHTFTKDGPGAVALSPEKAPPPVKKVMLSVADFAIQYLENRKQEKAKASWITHFNEDIAKLKSQKKQISTIENVEKILDEGRNALQRGPFGSTYYAGVTKKLYKALRDDKEERAINRVVTPRAATTAPHTPPAVARAPAPAVPSPSRPRDIPPATVAPDSFRAQKATLHEKVEHKPPQTGTPTLTLPNCQNMLSELSAYKKERQSEWDLSPIFYKLAAAIYTVLDGLTGSDHFSGKKREVKISAADKLEKLLTNEKLSPGVDFTTAEKNALQEGRLGKIVGEESLKSILSNINTCQSALGKKGPEAQEEVTSLRKK